MDSSTCELQLQGLILYTNNCSRHMTSLVILTYSKLPLEHAQRSSGAF